MVLTAGLQEYTGWFPEIMAVTEGNVEEEVPRLLPGYHYTNTNQQWRGFRRAAELRKALYEPLGIQNNRVTLSNIELLSDRKKTKGGADAGPSPTKVLLSRFNHFSITAVVAMQIYVLISYTLV